MRWIARMAWTQAPYGFADSALVAECITACTCTMQVLVSTARGVAGAMRAAVDMTVDGMGQNAAAAFSRYSCLRSQTLYLFELVVYVAWTLQGFGPVCAVTMLAPNTNCLRAIVSSAHQQYRRLCSHRQPLFAPSPCMHSTQTAPACA